MKIYIHPHTENNFQVKWSCPRTELLISEGLSKIKDIILVNSVSEADYVIWHHVPQNYGVKSFDIINTIPAEKLIIIDSIDENDQWFLPELDPNKYFLYFKRSIVKLTGTGYHEKIPLLERQFPWDYAILDHFYHPRWSKTIDIGCYLRPSCYYRSIVLRTMQSINYSDQLVVKIGQVSDGSRSIHNHVYFDPVYFEYLAQTKIVVCSGPFGWTGCSRPAEALANKCVYLSNECMSYMPNAPENNKHWVKIDPNEPRTIFFNLQVLLAEPEMIKYIAEEGYKHAKTYHSSKARMQYVIEKIKEFR